VELFQLERSSSDSYSVTSAKLSINYYSSEARG
jgi:hypothetical protein